MKKLLVLLTMLTSLAASADLGVGVQFSGAKDSWSASGPNSAAFSSSKMTTRYGVMLWLPVFPTFSLRTGYLVEDQEGESSSSNGPTYTVSIKNHLIPLNLQFGLPFVGLNIFGGVVFVGNDVLNPDAGYKLQSDNRLNLGVGYEFYSLPIGTLVGELEIQKGMNNLSPSPGFDLKVTSFSANLLYKVGF